MPNYLLLLHGGDWSDVDATEMKEVIAKYVAYSQQLRTEGRYVAGDEVKDQATLIHGFGNDSTAQRDANIPIHEKVGGYYIFSAKDLEEAIDVADDCPHNLYGGYMELREINS